MLELKYVFKSDIKPDPNNIRKDFSNQKDIEESIKKFGMINPIIVRKVKDHYIIVSGERRWRGLPRRAKIPVLITDLPEEKLQMAGIVDNLCRKDLTYFEKSHAVVFLMKKELGDDWRNILTKYIFYGQKKMKPRCEREANYAQDYFYEFLKIKKLLKQIGMAPNTAYDYIKLVDLPKESFEDNKTLKELRSLATAAKVEQEVQKATEDKEPAFRWFALFSVRRINVLAKDLEDILANPDGLTHEKKKSLKEALPRLKKAIENLEEKLK